LTAEITASANTSHIETQYYLYVVPKGLTLNSLQVVLKISLLPPTYGATALLQHPLDEEAMCACGAANRFIKPEAGWFLQYRMMDKVQKPSNSKAGYL
jgi:hypothetical protein